MKLNLGAGGTRIDGFTSVDLDPELQPDIAGDFRTMTFADVDEIYASHVLEHFFYGEAEAILRQWCGWLRPAGLLWLAVPDFEQIARLCAAGEHSPHLLGLLYGAGAKPEWAHHSGWTEGYLVATLEATGFAVLGRFEPFGQNADGNGADWSGAWHRTRDGKDVRVSLNLKATKNGDS
jgi:hypothetical protein